MKNRVLPVLLFSVLFALPGRADEQPGNEQQPEVTEKPSVIEALLSKPIIDPDQPWEEVRAYCKSRVPRMPEIRTAEEWQQQVEQLRQQVWENVIFRGRAAEWRATEFGIEWQGEIEGGPDYRIKKLRFEAVPGLWVPALLYEPLKLEGKVPVVMNVNGHDGAGKAADYKQIRCINQAKRGMIALNVEWLGMGQLRDEGFGHYRMNQLDLCGTSGLAPFYLSMEHGLTVLLRHPNADPQRVAVAGLSGGGWQTIFISSLDPRVTLSNPVAGYSSYITRADYISDLGDSEQTPCDLATVVDYTHLTAMRAPRPTLLTFNLKDNCCFASPHALEPLETAARPMFKLFNQDQALRTHVNADPGDHNFGLDNRQQLYKMFGDFFYPGKEGYSAEEIPCKEELKTAEQLRVDLPENNLNFHKLALDLMTQLPQSPELPTREEAEQWRAERRKALLAIVRSEKYSAQMVEASSKKFEAGTARALRFRLSEHWTVPGVEFTPANPQKTVLIVADQGRKSLAGEVESLLKQNCRVVAVDSFYFGENSISKRDFLYGLLVSAVGDRPLGIQAQQLAALSRWLHKTYGQPVELHAIGHRSSLFTLVAAALEEQAVSSVTLDGSLGSLKQVIQANTGVNQAPELFCFGLLEQFDVLQLAALVAPRPVRFVNMDPEAAKSLQSLPTYYQQLNSPFNPLAP